MRGVWLIGVAVGIVACGAPPPPPPVSPVVPPPPPADAAPPSADDELVHLQGAPSAHLPRAALAGPVVVVQQGHGGEPGAIAFDASGGWLVSADDARLIVWDLAAHVARARFAAPVVRPQTVAVRPDRVVVAVAGVSAVRVIDLVHATLAEPIPCENQALPAHVTLAWTADSRTLVMTCRGVVRVWSGDGAVERYALTAEAGLNDQISADAMVSPDGTRLAYRSNPTTVRVRALADGAPIATPAWPAEHYVADLAWRPDGHQLAVAGDDGVRTYDAARWTAGPHLAGADAGPLAYAPDGATLAVAIDQATFAWTPTTDAKVPLGSRAHWLHWPSPEVIAIDDAAFAWPSAQQGDGYACRGGCGDIAAVWSRGGAAVANRVDGDLKVWTVATKAELPALPAWTPAGHLETVGSVVVFPGNDAVRPTLDLATGRVGAPAASFHLLVSPDGTRALRGDRADGWQVVDLATSRVLARGKIAADATSDRVGWSADSRSVFALHTTAETAVVLRSWRARDLAPQPAVQLTVAPSVNEVVPLVEARVVVNGAHRVVDLVTGKVSPIEPAKHDDPWFPPVHRTASGKRFAFGRRVYDTATLATVADVEGNLLEFRPNHDDQVLVSADRGKVQLRSLGAPAAVITTFGDGDEFTSATFSDDGERLVTESSDGAALWEVARGTKVVSFVGDGGAMFGNRCLRRDDDGVHLTRIDTGATLEVYDVDRSPTGFIATQGDGAVQLGSTALAHALVRAAPAVDAALAPPAVSATTTFDLVARFVAGCQ